MNKELLITAGRDRALGTAQAEAIYNAIHSAVDDAGKRVLEVGYFLYAGAPASELSAAHREVLNSASDSELHIWERVNPKMFAKPRTLRDSDPEVDEFYGILRRGGSVLHAVELTAAKRNALLTKSDYAFALSCALRKYLVREYPEWLTLEFRKELKRSWGDRFKI